MSVKHKIVVLVGVALILVDWGGWPASAASPTGTRPNAALMRLVQTMFEQSVLERRGFVRLLRHGLLRQETVGETQGLLVEEWHQGVLRLEVALIVLAGQAHLPEAIDDLPWLSLPEAKGPVVEAFSVSSEVAAILIAIGPAPEVAGMERQLRQVIPRLAYWIDRLGGAEETYRKALYRVVAKALGRGVATVLGDDPALASILLRFVGTDLAAASSVTIVDLTLALQSGFAERTAEDGAERQLVLSTSPGGPSDPPADPGDPVSPPTPPDDNPIQPLPDPPLTDDPRASPR